MPGTSCRGNDLIVMRSAADLIARQNLFLGFAGFIGRDKPNMPQHSVPVTIHFCDTLLSNHVLIELVNT